MASNDLELDIDGDGVSFVCECGEADFVFALDHIDKELQCPQCQKVYRLYVYNLGWSAEVTDDEDTTLAEAEY